LHFQTEFKPNVGLKQKSKHLNKIITPLLNTCLTRDGQFMLHTRSVPIKTMSIDGIQKQTRYRVVFKVEPGVISQEEIKLV
jgi:hypothetical protein